MAETTDRLIAQGRPVPGPATGGSLLQGAGIAAETAISLIADSSAASTVLKTRARVVFDTLNGTDQPGTFDIAGLAKDLALRLAGAEGRARRACRFP